MTPPPGDSGPFGEDTPGRWWPAGIALLIGCQLALRHNLGGFGGKWTQSVAGKSYRAARLATRLGNRGGAPWYDLHAKR